MNINYLGSRILRARKANRREKAFLVKKSLITPETLGFCNVSEEDEHGFARANWCNSVYYERFSLRLFLLSALSFLVIGFFLELFPIPSLITILKYVE